MAPIDDFGALSLATVAVTLPPPEDASFLQFGGYGRTLYVGSCLNGRIFGFAYQSNTGALTPVPGGSVTFGASFCPTSMAATGGFFSGF